MKGDVPWCKGCQTWHGPKAPHLPRYHFTQGTSMKTKRAKPKKALSPGITFPLTHGGYEIREANEENVAAARSQILLNIDNIHRMVARIEMATARLHEKIDGAEPARIGSGNVQGIWMDREYVRNLEAKVKRLESKLDAVADGNIANHNRLNRIEERRTNKGRK